MHRLRPFIIVALVLTLGFLVWRFWPRGDGGETLSGYVEGETLYMSAATSGTVSSVSVRRGDRVGAGQPLFQIDPGAAEAQTAQAQAALRAAEATVRDAAKGQRPDELAIIQAQRTAARARTREAELAYGRVETLHRRGFAAKARLDQAQAELDTARAQLRETERRLDVAELGQREDQVAAARARAGQASGALTEAEIRARQRAPVAPIAARVEDVFFQPGEWAPANQPVVALLPDDRVKLRFFVREAEVARYRPGTRVRFQCDGCATKLTATVVWVSPRPEFTPPVIYSRDSRDKLVFLVEARPDRPRELTPGQPVDVTPPGGPPAVNAEAQDPASDLAVDVRGLNKSFGDKHVVNEVSIQVQTGRVTGFLGPNGSGKTTCLRMLCGLLTPDSGEGEVLGYDFRTQAREIKLRTGYMTQKFSLYDDLTIAENLQFMARVHGLDDREARVNRALDRLGLANRRAQLASKLSGGWKQRLALAAAILHEPRLLLLDEPTAGVDPKARREFWDEIHGLAAEGLTVMVSTHYMDEAERCHDIAYIAYGRLIARGTADAVIAASNLVTLRAEGQGADRLATELAGRPGVDMAAPFGLALHVSGTDREALEAAIAPWRKPPLEWTEVEPTLEDVFIHLMSRQEDVW